MPGKPVPTLGRREQQRDGPLDILHAPRAAEQTVGRHKAAAYVALPGRGLKVRERRGLVPELLEARRRVGVQRASLQDARFPRRCTSVPRE